MNFKDSALNFFYDKEADVLYIARGKPSNLDISNEEEDEVVVRRNRKTKEVRGLTIINFSKRAFNRSLSVKLPINLPLQVN